MDVEGHGLGKGLTGWRGRSSRPLLLQITGPFEPLLVFSLGGRVGVEMRVVCECGCEGGPYTAQSCSSTQPQAGQSYIYPFLLPLPSSPPSPSHTTGKRFAFPSWILIHNPCVERLKSTLGILMWFVVSTVIAYHIGILDQNPMLGTFPCALPSFKLLVCRICSIAR